MQVLNDGRQVKVFLFYFDEEFFTNTYPFDRQQLKEVVNKYKHVIRPSTKKRKINPSPIPTHARSRVVSPSPTTNASLERSNSPIVPIGLFPTVRASSMNNKREDYIRFCKTRNFSARPRRNRYDGEEIVVKNRKKQVTEEMKNAIIMICIEYGYSTLSKKERKNSAEDACIEAWPRLTCEKTAVSLWYQKYENMRVRGIVNPFTNDWKKRGRKNYVDQIEENYPRLLHQLFRQSQQIIGYDATFKELASSMNNIALLEFNVILSLTYHHVIVFFKKNKGKKLSAKEKPRLADEQKERFFSAVF